MTSAFQPFSEPRHFGDYILHGQLGTGGMAKVYVGQERLSGRRVALKIPHATSEVDRRRFTNEMRIVANLDHPNIVRCLACTEIEGHPVMVLELLQGRTLREVLQAEGALHWRRALNYALQVAKAINAAGSLQIVHRDLKPENVMCLSEQQLKVMDFGIAKLLGSSAPTTTQPLGTLRYMSPEQLEAKPLDQRSDLFALGVLLWEMLAGQAPFRGGSPHAVFEQIRVNPTPPLPESVRANLPEGTLQLLERLLAKRPDERPASAAVVVAWLESLLGTQAAVSHATQLQTSVPVIDDPTVAGRGVVGRAIDHLDGVAQEVEESINRFARMTSAWIVRMLIGVALYPAPALLLMFGVPAALAYATFDVFHLGGPAVSFSGWTQWCWPIAVLLVFPLTALVFIRRAWAHRRPDRDKTLRNWWLGSGLVALAIPIGFMSMQADGAQFTPAQHYLGMTVGAVWLSVTISLVTGAILSVLLHRHERNQAV